jgi:hypothetical protein
MLQPIKARSTEGKKMKNRINQCISYLKDHPENGRSNLINAGMPALIVDYAAHTMGNDKPKPLIVVCQMPGTTMVSYGLDDIRLSSDVL